MRRVERLTIDYDFSQAIRVDELRARVKAHLDLARCVMEVRPQGSTLNLKSD